MPAAKDDAPSIKSTPAAGQVHVLQKSIGLLEVLSHHGELTPAALAEISGEPRTTVHRLLASLRSLEMVDPGTTRGSYRVGMKVVEMANRLLSRLDERQVAHETMQRLHDDTDDTIYLCIRREDRAVCIERIDGRWVRSMVMELGASLPLHVGAAPMVLLAFAAPEDWSRYIAEHELVGMATPSVQDPVEFLLELKAARERGYAVSDGGAVQGLAGVAAPVFDYSDRLRASIGISGLSDALLGENTEATVRAVTAAALTVSRAMGFRG